MNLAPEVKQISISFSMSAVFLHLGILSGPQHQADSSFVFVFDDSRALLIWGEYGHQFHTDSLFYF